MKFFNAPRVSSPRSLMLPGPAPAAGGVPLLLLLLPLQKSLFAPLQFSFVRPAENASTKKSSF
jgi:hypothetical protein